MLACEKGHFGIVQLLINKGVGVNLQNNVGETAFMLACKNDHLGIVRYLVEEKKCIENNYYTDLLVACKNEKVRIVEYLLKLIPDRTFLGELLMIAIEKKYIDIVKLLLEHKVDPNFENDNTLSPLMLACENDHLGIVDILLEKGANPNLQNKNGILPLSIAAYKGFIDIVDILLKKGADPNLKNNQGITALNIALKSAFNGKHPGKENYFSIIIDKILSSKIFDPTNLTLNEINFFFVKSLDFVNGYSYFLRMKELMGEEKFKLYKESLLEINDDIEIMISLIEIKDEDIIKDENIINNQKLILKINKKKPFGIISYLFFKKEWIVFINSQKLETIFYTMLKEKFINSITNNRIDIVEELLKFFREQKDDYPNYCMDAFVKAICTENFLVVKLLLENIHLFSGNEQKLAKSILEDFESENLFSEDFEFSKDFESENLYILVITEFFIFFKNEINNDCEKKIDLIITLFKKYKPDFINDSNFIIDKINKNLKTKDAIFNFLVELKEKKLKNIILLKLIRYKHISNHDFNLDDFKLYSYTGLTPLTYSIKINGMEFFELLFNEGILSEDDLNEEGKNNLTPLNYLIEKKLYDNNFETTLLQIIETFKFLLNKRSSETAIEIDNLKQNFKFEKSFSLNDTSPYFFMENKEDLNKLISNIINFKVLNESLISISGKKINCVKSNDIALKLWKECLEIFIDFDIFSYVTRILNCFSFDTISFLNIKKDSIFKFVNDFDFIIIKDYEKSNLYIKVLNLLLITTNYGEQQKIQVDKFVKYFITDNEFIDSNLYLKIFNLLISNSNYIEQESKILEVITDIDKTKNIDSYLENILKQKIVNKSNINQIINTKNIYYIENVIKYAQLKDDAFDIDVQHTNKDDIEIYKFICNRIKNDGVIDFSLYLLRNNKFFPLDLQIKILFEYGFYEIIKKIIEKLDKSDETDNNILLEIFKNIKTDDHYEILEIILEKIDNVDVLLGFTQEKLKLKLLNSDNNVNKIIKKLVLFLLFKKKVNNIIYNCTFPEFKYIYKFIIEDDKLEEVDQIIYTNKDSYEDVNDKKAYLTSNINYNNQILNNLITNLNQQKNIKSSSKPIKDLFSDIDLSIKMMTNYQKSMNEYWEKKTPDSKEEIQKEIQTCIDNIYNKLNLPGIFNNKEYKDLLKICIVNYELVNPDQIRTKYKNKLDKLIEFIKIKAKVDFNFNSKKKFNGDGFEFIGDKLLKIIIENQYKQYENMFSDNDKTKHFLYNHMTNLQTNSFLDKLMEEKKIKNEILTLHDKYFVVVIPNGGDINKLRKEEKFYKFEEKTYNEENFYKNIWCADFLEGILFTLFLYDENPDEIDTKFEKIETRLGEIIKWWSEFTYGIDEIFTNIINCRIAIKNVLSSSYGEKKMSDGTFVNEYDGYSSEYEICEKYSDAGSTDDSDNNS